MSSEFILKVEDLKTHFTVNIRTGPGTDYAPVKIAKRGETYEAVDTNSWQAILLDGEIRWVSRKFSRALKFDENDEENLL